MTGEIERIAAEVERLEGPSREVDCEIATSVGIPPLYKMRGSITPTWPDYTSSLDAAMTLVPEGAFWSITMRGERRGGFHACCQLEGPSTGEKQPPPRSPFALLH